MKHILYRKTVLYLYQSKIKYCLVGISRLTTLVSPLIPLPSVYEFFFVLRVPPQPSLLLVLVKPGVCERGFALPVLFLADDLFLAIISRSSINNTNNNLLHSVLTRSRSYINRLSCSSCLKVNSSSL